MNFVFPHQNCSPDGLEKALKQPLDHHLENMILTILWEICMDVVEIDILKMVGIERNMRFCRNVQ